MFCPFIKEECRTDCTFWHTATNLSPNMKQNPNHCILAIAADEYREHLLRKVIGEEDQIG